MDKIFGLEGENSKIFEKHLEAELVNTELNQKVFSLDEALRKLGDDNSKIIKKHQQAELQNNQLNQKVVVLDEALRRLSEMPKVEEKVDKKLVGSEKKKRPQDLDGLKKEIET